MFGNKIDKKISFSKYAEYIIGLICYISLPLILLFFLTITASLLGTGSLNINVNSAERFIDVFLTFSLPMLVALAIVPILIKVFVQKCSLKQLGLTVSFDFWNILFCAFMGIASIILTIRLSNVEGLKVSAWTVLIHFFFVAIAEEIMLRGIIMDELQKIVTNKIALCLINGMIFAFIYHSSEGFMANLLVRVPLGFILSFARIKSDSVYPAIMLHLFYNMFVSTI